MCVYFESFSKEHFKDKRVIELGSGIGLLGIALSTICKSVVMTDLPKMLDILKRNFERNKSLFCQQKPFLYSVTSLEWNNKTEIQNLNPPFDIIVGSDITYEEEHIPSLVETLLQLSNDDTEIFIGYEERKMSSESLFFKLVEVHFEITETVDVRNLHDSIPNGPPQVQK